MTAIKNRFQFRHCSKARWSLVGKVVVGAGLIATLAQALAAPANDEFELRQTRPGPAAEAGTRPSDEPAADANEEVLNEILQLRMQLGGPWTEPEDAKEFFRALGQLHRDGDVSPLIEDIGAVPSRPPANDTPRFPAEPPLPNPAPASYLRDNHQAAATALLVAAQSLLTAAKSFDQQAYELEEMGESDEADHCRRLAKQAWSLSRRARLLAP